jgi:hypothetical protein
VLAVPFVQHADTRFPPSSRQRPRSSALVEQTHYHPSHRLPRRYHHMPGVSPPCPLPVQYRRLQPPYYRLHLPLLYGGAGQLWCTLHVLRRAWTLAEGRAHDRRCVVVRPLVLAPAAPGIAATSMWCKRICCPSTSSTPSFAVTLARSAKLDPTVAIASAPQLHSLCT